MREFDYNPTIQMTHEQAIARPQPVCVLIGSDGQTEGVLVQALGERFVIEPKDFNDGNEMTWDDAMTELKAEGKTTFTQQQAHLILYLRVFINAALSSIGGDKLARYYWTATEYGLHYALYASFVSGSVYGFFKCNSYIVRAVRRFS